MYFANSQHLMILTPVYFYLSFLFYLLLYLSWWNTSRESAVTLRGTSHFSYLFWIFLFSLRTCVLIYSWWFDFLIFYLSHIRERSSRVVQMFLYALLSRYFQKIFKNVIYEYTQCVGFFYCVNIRILWSALYHKNSDIKDYWVVLLYDST